MPCIGAEENETITLDIIPVNQLQTLVDRTIQLSTTRSWRPAYGGIRVTKIDLENQKITGLTKDETVRTFSFREIYYFKIVSNENRSPMSTVQFAILNAVAGKSIPLITASKTPFELANGKLTKINTERKVIVLETPTGIVEFPFDSLRSLRVVLPKPKAESSSVAKDELRPWKLKVIETLITAISPNQQRELRALEQSTQSADDNRKTRVDIDMVALNRDRLLDAKRSILLGTLDKDNPTLHKLVLKKAVELKRQEDLAKSQYTPFMLEELKRRKRAIESQIRFIRDRGDRGRMLAELDRFEKAEKSIKDGTLKEKDAELHRVLFSFAEKASKGFVDQKKREDRSRR